MISAKEARQIAIENKDYAERMRAQIIKSIITRTEWHIKELAKRGETYFEKNINKDYAKEVKAILLKAGYKVKVRRDYFEVNCVNLVIEW